MYLTRGEYLYCIYAGALAKLPWILFHESVSHRRQTTGIASLFYLWSTTIMSMAYNSPSNILPSICRFMKILYRSEPGFVPCYGHFGLSCSVPSNGTLDTHPQSIRLRPRMLLFPCSHPGMTRLKKQMPTICASDLCRPVYSRITDGNLLPISATTTHLVILVDGIPA
ncbi:hypothetical protein OE88DRAFT_976148 [Heliocybe sulcata]|uniref:Uncharacterized protein n=1 Tax=Heliocybe sulcata TaxID=5364 RepID=A0A5C3NC82_9AGAM|nr:hypothetical protein OE88DRAFT_976148 [Heliocybe sulcata]